MAGGEQSRREDSQGRTDVFDRLGKKLTYANVLMAVAHLFSLKRE